MLLYTSSQGCYDESTEVIQGESCMRFGSGVRSLVRITDSKMSLPKPNSDARLSDFLPCTFC